MSIEYASNDSSKFFFRSTENKDLSTPLVVHFDAKEGSIQCTCGKFKMMGLLYSHYMRVLRYLDIVNIPEKYLLL
ncbi:hypothetical protein IEQ34_019006 [Dendrobium chrysotoxum]|uniref:Zinc finger PMZ-type domain-containing protein n=1 Tax=Dendrobium chrysotoxum TaxID=161865 RepID=A0AAV7G658_DENCH|nr:hypothetical protein IEQ34_019006 [Dendrobium chrysotoxum]